MKTAGIKQGIKTMLAAAALLCTGTAWANPHPWQMSMPEGVTPSSHQVHFLFLLSFWVCVGLGIVVFSVMAIAIVRFRKSKGAVAEKWAHNTKLEIAWTIVPVLILVVLAWPASTVLADMSDTTGSNMTVKVTGYQWKWRYDYVSYNDHQVDKVGFMSRLDKESDKARQLDSGIDPRSVTDDDGYNTYLLDVDKPLVVPVGTEIRFIITGGDVIHSWWVPDLGWKQDAIPGIVNSMKATINKPGKYYGQCAELCGQGHGFMPIVVKAVPKAQFQQWLASKEDGAAADKTARTAQVSEDEDAAADNRS